MTNKKADKTGRQKDRSIPYGRQSIFPDDKKAVMDVLESDFLTQGPKVAEFAEKLCEYTGARFCVPVSNGTAALHLAVRALEVKSKKNGVKERQIEGITSPNTFVASANSMVLNGIKPVFADIDATTYCMDPLKIEEKITKDTGMIIPVHFAGHPCEMESIHGIALKYGLHVIEDAAHAIGSRYPDGSRVGSCHYSDMTIFSFHPVKTITTGEGGAITTNDPELYERLQLLANHGITRERADFILADPELDGPWYYEMQHLGFNYRITDLQCALGITQLEKVDGFIRKRREIVETYNTAFGSMEQIIIPHEKKGNFSAFHLYVIQVKGLDRSLIFNELKKQGLDVNVHYIPVHLQPYYRETFCFKKGDFPRAETYYKNALTLPLFPGMTQKDIKEVISKVKTITLKIS